MTYQIAVAKDSGAKRLIYYITDHSKSQRWIVKKKKRKSKAQLLFNSLIS